MLTKTRNFLSDVKTELGKVTWPERKETIATTWVVVVIVLIISAYLGVCDYILSGFVRFILR